MSRTIKSVLATVVAGLVIAGVATAASTPTITAESARNLSNLSATVTATINPDGSATGYVFQYGPTNAYGYSTKSHSIRTGTKPVTVEVTLTGLTPGTAYHFHVVALNAAGSASGVDKTFTTTGPPPAQVVTGPAVNVGKTTATATGSVNPEGVGTTWAVQYGLTPLYGSQTIQAQPLAAVTTSLPVSAVLAGLAPGVVWHYRVVAYHADNIVSAGADATFLTEPSIRPEPKITVHTSPGRDRKRPFSWTTSGSLGGASSIPSSAKCAGTLTLKYYVGRKKIGNENAQLGPDCKFSVPNSFRHIRAPFPAKVTIKVHFNGNGYIAAVDHTNTVTAG